MSLLRPLTRNVATIVAVALAPMLGACGGSPAVRSYDGTRVDSLRRAAGAPVALRFAELELERLAATRAAAPWQVASARCDVDELRRIVEIPDSVRAAFLEAERLTPAVIMGGDPEDRARLLQLERQREMRARWLGPDAPGVAQTLSAMARLERALGNATRARALDERALAIRLSAFGELHPLIAESEAQLGRDHKLAGISPRDALFHAERALDLTRRLRGERTREYARMLGSRASVRRWTRHFEDAIRDLQQASRILAQTDGEGSIPVADCTSDIAVTRQHMGNLDEADRWSARAESMYEALGGPASGVRAMNLNVRGMVLIQLRRFREASRVLEKAASVQETRWRNARPDPGRAKVFPLAAYHSLAVVKVQLGDTLGAWVSAERGVSRSLLDRISDRHPIDTGDPWRDLLPRAQAALSDSAALVGWVDTPVRAGFGFPNWCYVVRKQGRPRWFRVDAPAWWESPGNPPPILWLREHLRAAAGWPIRIASQPEADRFAEQAYEIRFEPMEVALEGVRELIAVSPTINDGLPLEVLRDRKGQRLVDRFAITYAPSALIYVLESERGRARERGDWRGLLLRTVITGSTPERGRLPTGDGAAKLARSVRDLILLTGTDASERRLRSLARDGTLAQVDLMHVAAHGRTAPGWAFDSGLVLAEVAARDSLRLPEHDDPSDGYLTISEVSSWRFQASLVCLASCQSSGSEGIRTEGIAGMGQALLECGARSVLESVWTVEDRATNLLFDRFYQELLSNGSERVRATEALRRAKIWLRDFREVDGRQPYADPVFWAGFVLLGYPDA